MKNLYRTTISTNKVCVTYKVNCNNVLTTF